MRLILSHSRCGGFCIALTMICLAICPLHGQARRSGQAQAHAESPSLTLVRRLPGSPWVHYNVEGPARQVNAFLVHDERPKPVIVMVQGSGCVPLFTIDGDGVFSGTSIFEDFVAARSERFHFAMLEKQGVAPLQFTLGMKHEEKLALFRQVERGGCSAAYFENETKRVRVEDVAALIRALRGQPWVQQILLVGHSEGTRVVAGVIRQDFTRTLSAAGFLSSATVGDFTRDSEDRDAFRKAFETMQMLQRSDDNEMYEGHAVRRWKSYTLDSTPLEDIRESTLPLFIAYGGREKNILGADAFSLEALRQQPERPLRYVIVHDGDHGFSTPDGRAHMDRVLDDFITWALDSQRPTGPAILK